MILSKLKKSLSKYMKKWELFSVIMGIILFLFSVIYIGFNLIPGFSKVLIYDSFIYYQMSLNPFIAVAAPYTYRILTPLIVYFLPLENIFGFFIINISSLLFSGVIFYYYLKKLNFNSCHSFLGVLFFLAAPTVIYSLYDIALVDNLSFLFIALGFYFIVTEKDFLYLIILLIGILNKETILYTIPFFFIYKLEYQNLKIAAKKTMMISIPVLVVFLIIRYQIGLTDYFSIETIKKVLWDHAYQFNLFQKLPYLSFHTFKNPFLAFGTLWFIFAYGLKNIENKFLKKSLYILPLIFLQILISTDIYRVLFIGYPIIIPISLYLFKIDNLKAFGIFMTMTLAMIITYALLIPLNGLLFGLITLPLEIIILTSLVIAFLQKRIKNKVPC